MPWQHWVKISLDHTKNAMTHLFGILTNAKLRILLSQKIGHILHVYFEERAASGDLFCAAALLLELLDALEDVVHAAGHQSTLISI